MYMIVAYTHDKPPPASSFVTAKPEFVPLFFGLIVWIITHSFTIDRNPQALLTILICFTRWIVQKFKITPPKFKSTLHAKPPFLALCLRVKSNSCQDSSCLKNRLFFASGRILVGIGRTHSGTDTPASILPARACAYRLRLHWSWSRDWHAPCLHRPFLHRLNRSPGLPGQSCNRFFIVWIIEFIRPGHSSKVAKMVLRRFILVLNQLLVATARNIAFYSQNIA